MHSWRFGRDPSQNHHVDTLGSGIAEVIVWGHVMKANLPKMARQLWIVDAKYCFELAGNWSLLRIYLYFLSFDGMNYELS